MLKIIKNIKNKSTDLLFSPIKLYVKYVIQPIRKISDILLNNEFKRFIQNPKNPFNKYGKRCFSQCDEDGITLEIIKRLNLKEGTFLEVGCGTGLQNNTLILAALNWKGIWVDPQELKFNYKKSKKLVFNKTFATEENITDLISESLKKLNSNQVDYISIDIDGADYLLVKKILENKINAKVFVVEINQKIPPPIEFVAKLENTNDIYDDYFGASLSAYSKLFKKFGYSAVCVSSIMGHNAFFVKDEYMKLFKEVPNDIEDIYITPNFWSYSANYKTITSKKMVENFFN